MSNKHTSEDKYAPITYSLRPCETCKSERVMLLRGNMGGFHVECLGHPAKTWEQFPPDNGEGGRVECNDKTEKHNQWPDAVNEWNRKNG